MKLKNVVNFITEEIWIKFNHQEAESPKLCTVTPVFTTGI